MTWRLNKETAGSGALGDIASHAIDQVLFLLADRVTEVSGRLHAFVDRRPEIRDFLAAIDGGTPPSPSFEEGLAVQRVLAAIEASANAKSCIIQLATAAVSATEGA